MLRTFLITSTVAAVLAIGIPTGSAAPRADGQGPISTVGKATKDAGKTTAKGTKEAVKKTGDVTEDAAQKTATETKNAGKRVEGAADPDKVSARCKDGTVQTARTKIDACRRHGGVKP